MVAAADKAGFSARLNVALDRLGYPAKGKGRQVALAKDWGVSQKGARKWLEGESIPHPERLSQMAVRYGVTVEYLRTGRHEVRDTQAHYGNTAPASYSAGAVPLISWVQAGHWTETVDTFQPGDAEEWLPRPSNAGPHTFALRVVGDSMTSPYPGQRSYPQGTIIYVDPDREVTNGSRVIAKLNGDEVTFKQYRVEGSQLYLQPLNPQYPMIEISAEVAIVGVVVGSYLPE